jgi:AcrR family transcriptional regulator
MLLALGGVNALTDQVRSSKTRAYRMRQRAENVEETRRRIVEATTELHESIGPAHTTIAGIAERAGVTRLTVYRHFPDDETLFLACSAHWRAQQRLPDPEAWRRVADAEERLRAGLTDLYRFYRDGEPMLRSIYRDLDALPATLREGLSAREIEYRDVLLEPFGRARRHHQLLAAVGHAVSFWTWRSLCIDHGLSNRSAVGSMTAYALAVRPRQGHPDPDERRRPYAANPQLR